MNEASTFAYSGSAFSSSVVLLPLTSVRRTMVLVTDPSLCWLQAPLPTICATSLALEELVHYLSA